jgi:hypothetical protein
MEEKKKVYIFNVGGTLYYISRESLFGPRATEGCYLQSRVKEEWKTQENIGIPYIDRDPQVTVQVFCSNRNRCFRL